ncbi:SDR family oxidoreductase [Roseomonas sp. AR75]|uniref:SDR family oxidoreductase n=1 Tax=Roseomonas sp. AR75 TaxID=2562311 RepID=UPI001F0DA86D|nr:SDR family oxidoreductase [Roseomonas sp. AR75]
MNDPDGAQADRRGTAMRALEGRTVLVTGAARGVGRALAEACLAAGARVVIADVLQEAGRATAAQIGARFVPVDLADPDSIAAMADSIARTEGVLHGLVNNAAIATGIGGPDYDAIEIGTWDRVMSVNVRGTWLVTRNVGKLLAASGSGRVVNLASDTALWGAPRLLAYVASKGAVISMTRSLAREMGPRGIGVTAVAPGILRNEATDYVPAERHALYEKGRAAPGAMVPEDIAPTVVFLLTPGALAVTGQVLPVNNGFVFA